MFEILPYTGKSRIASRKTFFIRHSYCRGFTSKLISYLSEESTVFFVNKDRSITVTLKYSTDYKRVVQYLIANFKGKIVEEFTSWGNNN